MPFDKSSDDETKKHFTTFVLDTYINFYFNGMKATNYEEYFWRILLNLNSPHSFDTSLLGKRWITQGNFYIRRNWLINKYNEFAWSANSGKFAERQHLYVNVNVYCSFHGIIAKLCGTIWWNYDISFICRKKKLKIARKLRKMRTRMIIFRYLSTKDKESKWISPVKAFSFSFAIRRPSQSLSVVSIAAWFN